MAAPDLTNEFNGEAGLLKGLFMWLFGMNDENGQPINFMDLLKTIFGGAPATQPTPTPTPPQTSTATTPTPTSTTPTPTTAPQTTRKLVTYGDSLAQGYGQGLTKEFGAANVTNYGVVNAGLLGGTHLANVDWTKISKDTTVLISVGTNDVGFLSAKNPGKIDSYAQQVVDIAAKVKANGGTPILVAMRAPDNPLSWTDKSGVTHTQTPAEFTAWKDTLNKMNDAIGKAAAAQGVKFVTQEGGEYVAGGVHQTTQGYQNTADNALKQAGVTVSA